MDDAMILDGPCLSKVVLTPQAGKKIKATIIDAHLGLDATQIDPVITPLGHTYDRPELERAFMCGYNFEPQAPTTDLCIDDVIPNRAIEEAVTFYRRHMMRFNVLLKR